jgi:hypothetical protein
MLAGHPVGYVEHVDASQNQVADALRQELEWTRRQHAQWIQERSEMVAAIKELRARVHDSESHFQRNGDLELVEEIDRLSAALRDAEDWNRELTAARDWHNSQAKGWEAEVERVSARWEAEVERVSAGWEAEVERLSAEWEAEAERLSSALADAMRWNASLEAAGTQLTEARDWHASQARNWQREAEKLAADLKVEEGRTKELAEAAALRESKTLKARLGRIYRSVKK